MPLMKKAANNTDGTTDGMMTSNTAVLGYAIINELVGSERRPLSTLFEDAYDNTDDTTDEMMSLNPPESSVYCLWWQLDLRITPQC